MRIAWGTDWHLDHLSHKQLSEFMKVIASNESDVLILTGDISNADRLNNHLGLINQASPVPVYFVLGNHDYYGSSSMEATQALAGSHGYKSKLAYLDNSAPFQLDWRTWLVGVGGWADGRAGNFMKSKIWINDYSSIPDLAIYRNEKSGLLQHLKDQKDEKELKKQVTSIKRSILRHIKELGKKQANVLRRQLKKLPEKAEHVLVATHVPPWQEAAWHGGTASDDDWAPHFACVSTGEVLKEFMEENLDRTMTVLCGHTHGHGEVDILPNLKCITQASCEDGRDKYEEPWISHHVEVS
jgi:predicted phosphohydrolase